MPIRAEHVKALEQSALLQFENETGVHSKGFSPRLGRRMRRAEQIPRRCVDYFAKVSGARAENAHKALKDPYFFVRTPITFSADEYSPGLLCATNEIFLRKAEEVGKASVKNVIHDGIVEDRQYGFNEVRQGASPVALKFGHGCTDDPPRSCISRALKDSRTRVERLERKPVTWLNHVVAGNERHKSEQGLPA
ncbi:MAG: hypothetical protein ACKV2U_15685 [Bryobacteraceae bacterium]